MKSFIIVCLVLSVIGRLSSAAATTYREQARSESNDLATLVDALRGIQLGQFPSQEESVETQQLDWISPILGKFVPSLVNGGVSVVGPLITELGKIGINVGERLVTNIIDCIICGQQCVVPNQSQGNVDESGRVAKLMAVVDALENIDAVEQKLNDLKRSMMKDNQMAEIEVRDWIAKVIEKVRDIAKSIKSASKKVLCRNNY